MCLLVIQKWSHLGPCLYLGPAVQQQPYHDDVAPAGGYVQGSDPILTEEWQSVRGSNPSSLPRRAARKHGANKRRRAGES